MSVEVDRQPSIARAIKDTAGAWRAAADDPSSRPTLIHRVVLVIAAFSLFSTLLSASGPTVRWGFVGILLAIGVCTLVAVIVCGFTVQSMRWFGRIEWILLGLALGALALWTLANILQNTWYRSDEEIFVQYSANLLRHGHNPYGADMMPAYAQYPAPFPTKLLDGSITHSLDYPGLPTLLTAALTAVVGDFHTVAVLCTLALFAAALVTFKLLPRGLRSLAPLLVVGVPVFASGSAGGLLFCLVIAPLAFTAYRWQHTGEGGRLSRMDLAKAAAVGIAVSTTQVAWFPIPFLFLGIFLRRRRELGRRGALKVTGKFIGAAFAVFFAINAVFIFWGPSAWLHGVFAPITQHAVPEGQGLVNVIQSLSIGSGNLTLYTYAGALVMIGLLVAYWRHFDRLNAACFALPLVGLLFPARSYWTYFIAYGAAWMVELLSHDPEPDLEPAAASPDDADDAASDGPNAPSQTPVKPAIAWYKKPIALTAAAFIPAAGLFGLALASPQPIKITIDKVLTSAQLATVQTVDVTAENTSGSTLEPHFMAVHGDGMVSPTWNIVSGPTTLAPHSTAHYELVAPNYGSLAAVGQGLKMQAVTDKPATISYSQTKTIEQFTTILTYDEPTTPILAENQPITLTARIESQYGQPIRRAGVTVCLVEVLFSNSGNSAHDSTIVADPKGPQTTCGAKDGWGVTDAEGTVRFTVASTSTAGRLLYYQTHAVQSGKSFGYSNFLTVAWK